MYVCMYVCISGNCAREVFFSSKALAILLTTMLSNLTLRKDQKVRLLFAELIANLAEISSQVSSPMVILLLIWVWFLLMRIYVLI